MTNLDTIVNKTNQVLTTPLRLFWLKVPQRSIKRRTNGFWFETKLKVTVTVHDFKKTTFFVFFFSFLTNKNWSTPRVVLYNSSQKKVVQLKQIVQFSEKLYSIRNGYVNRKYFVDCLKARTNQKHFLLRKHKQLSNKVVQFKTQQELYNLGLWNSPTACAEDDHTNRKPSTVK